MFKFWKRKVYNLDLYICFLKRFLSLILYISMGVFMTSFVYAQEKEQKATFRNLITWDKGNGQGQNSENTRSYAIADEKCLFAMCGVQGFNNNADNYFEGWEPIRDYLLEQRLKAFLPKIKLHHTNVEQYSFLKGLNAHYHVMNEENYNEVLNSNND